MTPTTYKHNAPHKGTFGYEISTSFDRGHERGIAEVRVQPQRDGLVEVDVTHSKWDVYGTGKNGRTNTRSGAVVLSREQVRNLIAVLTEAITDQH